MRLGYVLREEGEKNRYAPKNVKALDLLKDIVFYVATLVTYYYKGDIIIYNNLNNVLELLVYVNTE